MECGTIKKWEAPRKHNLRETGLFFPAEMQEGFFGSQMRMPVPIPAFYRDIPVPFSGWLQDGWCCGNGKWLCSIQFPEDCLEIPEGGLINPP